MNVNQQDKKNMSKVFDLLRAQLNDKEKELVELQRTEPFLLPPDSEQTNILINQICSLHLSTPDQSFLFSTSSTCLCDKSRLCSTDVDSIKTLPLTVWLANEKSMKEEKVLYRLPMVTHLLSLPFNCYLSSSRCSVNCEISSSIETKVEPLNRLPMVSELLSMPLDAFRSKCEVSPANDCPQIEFNEKNTDEKKRFETSKSVLDGQTIYSKEFWLRKGECSSSMANQSVPLDLDKYIEQSSEKMRRLHLKYVEALDQLKTNSNNSSQSIQCLYPQVFDRIQQDLSCDIRPVTLSSSK